MKKPRYPVYLLTDGDGQYYDGDGEPIRGWQAAKRFGHEFEAKKFVESHPRLSKICPRVECRFFTDKELTMMERDYSMHMRLKSS